MNDRKESKRPFPPSIPWSKTKEKLLSDPEVRAEYEALEPEFALIRQLIDLRLKRGFSQRQLAKRAGMEQSVIARLEGGKPAGLRTLRRVADALDADVRITLVPRQAKPKRGKMPARQRRM